MTTMDFTAWIDKVDHAINVWKAVNRKPCHSESMPLRDWYDAGMTPSDATTRAIRDAQT